MLKKCSFYKVRRLTWLLILLVGLTSSCREQSVIWPN